jgi:CRP-like cAMP-binding protein
MAVRNAKVMKPSVEPPTLNRIIAALPRGELERVMAELEPFALPVNTVLYEAGETIEYVYFPTSGCVSMVNVMEEGAVEVGTIGFEGFTGLPLLLDDDQMPSRAFVQLAGQSHRMDAATFRKSVENNPMLARLLARNSLALFNQVAQSVACNRLHTLESRCARWLLMTHDRMLQQPFLLTQEFLSYMLGVHRPAVTIAAGVLQRAGLIHYTRGMITVVDRAGLEGVACECYAITQSNYARLEG